jgi:hypothetical protein
MTIFRTLACILAGAVAFASSSALADDAVAPAASAPPTPARSSAEATKARQDADRQRLVAKLRAEAPKTEERQKGTVLDLPIFNRHNRP